MNSEIKKISLNSLFWQLQKRLFHVISSIIIFSLQTVSISAQTRYTVFTAAGADCNLTITKVSKINPSSCADNGSITITRTGGISPFEFTLTKQDGSVITQSANTFTGLSDGIYNIKIVDAQGCTKDTSGITLTKPAILGFNNLVLVNPPCVYSNKGSITIHLDGGTAPFNYTLITPDTFFTQISSGGGNFRNLPEGIYEVKVTDAAGCMIDSSGIILTQEQCPKIIITNSYPADHSTYPSGTENLCVVVNDTNKNEKLRIRFYGRKKNPANRKFTMIYLPDAQQYTGNINGGNNNMFKSQTQWIVNNRISRNIVYAGQLGDIVNYSESEVQWKRADTAMTILEDKTTTGLKDGIPYGICSGNHDGTTFYNNYFGVSRFLDRSYYGGHDNDDNKNHFTLFSAAGIDFLVISLKYSFSDQTLNWAENLVRSYTNRKVVVETHWPLGIGGGFSNDGQRIYDKLKNYPNFILMVGGHIGAGDGEALRSDTLNGNIVYTLLQDYQIRENGGHGLLRIFEFDPDNNNLAVQTYSPYTNEYETDYNSQFNLNVKLDSTCCKMELIGEKTDVVSSDSNICTSWSSLQKNSEYEWYTEVFDGTTTYTSPTWSFTTNSGVNPPAISVNGSTTFCEGGSVTLTSNNSTGNQWLKDGVIIEDATGQSFIANSPGSYAVRVNFDNGFSSVSDTVNVHVKTTPPAPTIIVQDNCGSSTLTATNFTGSLLWSTGATTPAITVESAGVYTVTQTENNGCTSMAASASAVPKAIPPAPVVTVQNNCGNSVLTATGYTGDLLWSNGATTASIKVTTGGIYTVTQSSANACTSASGSATAEPKAVPVTSLLNQNNVTCYGAANGSVTVFASGGTGSYMYKKGSGGAPQESPTFNNLRAVSYKFYTVDGNGCTSTALGVTITRPEKVTVSISSQSNVTCYGGNDGSVTLSAGGGNGSYMYKKGNGGSLQTSPTFSNLKAGTYSFYAVDGNGCTSSALSAIISRPEKVIVSISSQSNLTCYGGNNGSVTLSASGGNGSYMYKKGSGGSLQASPTFSSLRAGTYGFYAVDGNGCTSSALSVTITRPTQIAEEIIDQKNVTCYGGNDGSVTVSASGGGGSYLYKKGSGALQASPTFSNLKAGTYKIYAVDANGCTSAALVVTITQPASGCIFTCTGASTSNSVSITPSGNVSICEGESITLKANKRKDVTYAWLKNGKIIPGETGQTLTVTESGGYQVVEFFSGGCTFTSDATTVTKLALPTVSITALFGNTDLCNTGLVILYSDWKARWHYQWVKDGRTIEGANYGFFITTEPGAYSVRVTNEGGCSQTSKDITVINSCDGVPYTKVAPSDKLRVVSSLWAYPNPTSGYLTVIYQSNFEGKIELKVYDVLGRLVFNKPEVAVKGTNNYKLDLGGLASGTYTLQLTNRQEQKQVKIFVGK